MTEPKMVLVPAPLLTATIRYLGMRPYGEVAQLVAQLMACKAAETTEPPGPDSTPGPSRLRGTTLPADTEAPAP